MNMRINVKTTSDRVRYKPFLKTVVFGRNIQKEETTKNSSDNPFSRAACSFSASISILAS